MTAASRRKADAEAIATATRFVVSFFLGRGQYRREETASLETARALRDAAGSDEYGRRGVIYAVAPDGRVVCAE